MGQNKKIIESLPPLAFHFLTTLCVLWAETTGPAGNRGIRDLLAELNKLQAIRGTKRDMFCALLVNSTTRISSNSATDKSGFRICIGKAIHSPFELQK